MARNRGRKESEALRLEILRRLQADCSKPNKDIAFDLKIDPATLSRLQNNLEKDGVIQRYSAILDPEKSGLETLAFIRVALEKTDEAILKETVDKLATNQHVQEIHNIEGAFDLLLKVRVRSNAQVMEFIHTSLTLANNIKDTETMLTMGTLKETTYLPV